jgi:hypothetical protein
MFHVLQTQQGCYVLHQKVFSEEREGRKGSTTIKYFMSASKTDGCCKLDDVCVSISFVVLVPMVKNKIYFL